MSKQRFREAIEAFDAIHSEDPEKVIFRDLEVSKAQRYHERLSYWVCQLTETPSEELQLAARCQHLLRKEIPRNQFPEGRTGYRKWRTSLADFHTRRAGEILRAVGYSEETIERVGQLLKKRSLKLDPEVQLFEDAICLVFLEFDLLDFSRKHDETKMTAILSKTWKKMSENGHRCALELVKGLPSDLQVLIRQAVQASSSE